MQMTQQMTNSMRYIHATDVLLSLRLSYYSNLKQKKFLHFEMNKQIQYVVIELKMYKNQRNAIKSYHFTFVDLFRDLRTAKTLS